VAVAHGGGATAANRPGHGASVTLTLPASNITLIGRNREGTPS
jgi:signal transduction histidine kinase